MKLTAIKLSLLTSSFLLLPVLSLADNAFPVFPMAFWGNANLNGLPMPAGTTIRAYCSDNLIGEITMVENGAYGYNEATKNKLLVSSCDNDIVFKYLPSGTSDALSGSSEIKYTGEFISGNTIYKDLEFTIITPPSTTGGTSGGGGGGGGGGGYSAPAPEESTKETVIGKSDMNADGKVDFNDFATFALIYKKTYTNSDEKISDIPVSWGDFDSDGDVDFDDFAIFALSYEK